MDETCLVHIALSFCELVEDFGCTTIITSTVYFLDLSVLCLCPDFVWLIGLHISHFYKTFSIEIEGYIFALFCVLILLCESRAFSMNCQYSWERKIFVKYMHVLDND